MGLNEIGSPEKSPAAAAGRRKLASYFMASDERRTPTEIIGGDYAVGIAPVNLRGKPIEDLSKTGGWIAAFFNFGNEMAERMAYFGLTVNMVMFMFSVMHQPFSSLANTVNNFLGISQASSVIGGFLSDAYLGRYWTITIFTTVYLLGLTGITLCATMHVFTPSQSNCDQLSVLLGNCEQPKQCVRFLTGHSRNGGTYPFYVAEHAADPD